jgi:putative MFS transporter
MSTADAVDGGSARESRIREQPRLTLERVGARMDRLPLSRWHVILLLCVGAILLFQYMDNYAFSYASPGAIAELHLTVAQVGDINTYFGVGGLVVAIVAGLVVDRLGRRRTLIFFTAWYSLFCTANALVGTPLQFMLARTLSGFGATGASVAALSIGAADSSRSSSSLWSSRSCWPCWSSSWASAPPRSAWRSSTSSDTRN